jgi:hypothetical protein
LLEEWQIKMSGVDGGEDQNGDPGNEEPSEVP